MTEEKISASRRKSTHEQLRSDHIELLLKLKSTEDSNKALLIEILELKEQLLSAISSSTSFDNPATNYREDWLTASQKNSDLAKELALVKKNASDDLHRLRDQQAKAFEDYTATMRRMQQSIKELQDEKLLASKPTAINNDNESQVALLQSQLQILQSQLATSLTEAATTNDRLGISQTENLTLQRTVAELRSQYTEQSQMLIAVTASLQTCKMDYDNSLSKISSLQDEDVRLRAELHALRLLISETLLLQPTSAVTTATAAVVMTTIGIQTTSTEENPSNNNTSNSTPSIPSLQLTQEREQQQQQQQQVLSEEEEMPLGFRFQEYLRLKRENKELKLRLAEKEKASYSRSSSGKSRGGVLKSSGSSTTLPRLL